MKADFLSNLCTPFSTHIQSTYPSGPCRFISFPPEKTLLAILGSSDKKACDSARSLQNSCSLELERRRPGALPLPFIRFLQVGGTSLHSVLLSPPPSCGPQVPGLLRRRHQTPLTWPIPTLSVAARRTSGTPDPREGSGSWMEARFP